ncbi:hypothetical protein ACFSTA_18275 [Ornithinibacillus salinisoli]|uniref:Uncharacterized protein n=1 Tax=Ornithinibacillus salinisoli TaxID=1848459 RepID=A0ABW4W1E4_9BACI
MNNFAGNIFCGEFDQVNNNFYLNQVKNLHTASTLSESQLINLVNYLNKQVDTCTITVNDQIPILLQQDEIQILLKELDLIMHELDILDS